MRISDMVNIFQEYFILGNLMAIVATAMIIGIWIVSKKRGKKLNKTIPELLGIVVFVGYCVIVLGATLLSRGSWYENSIGWNLFSSYKNAWYTGSVSEWRNLILNILLFVPMGFLIPVVFRKMNSCWKIYLTGFAASLFIEIVQFVFNRGIVELDDVFNNTLGTMIGYGGWMIFLCIFCKEKKKGIGKQAVFCQMPLLLALVVFVSLYFTYVKQPYGNYLSQNVTKHQIENVRVDEHVSLSAEAVEAAIYKVPMVSEAEAMEYANELLAGRGTAVDESENDPYENTLVMRSQDGNYHVWVDYVGKAVWFTDFSIMEDTYANDLEREKVVAILKNYGIDVPQEAGFTVNTITERGMYCFEADYIIENNQLINGILTCSITTDGVIQNYRNEMLIGIPCETISCMSKKEALDKVKSGIFYAEYNVGSELQIKEIELEYALDSKAYYQPVYVITLANDDIIIVPAAK